MSMIECIDAVGVNGTVYEWWTDVAEPVRTDKGFVSVTVTCWHPDHCLDGGYYDEALYDEALDEGPTITVTVTAKMIRDAILALLADEGASPAFRASLRASVDAVDDCGNVDDADMADCIMQQAVYGKQKWT